MGKEKVILAYSGGLDTTAISMLYVYVSMSDRKASWKASTREPNIQELRSSTFWMSLMNSVMSTSFQV